MDEAEWDGSADPGRMIAFLHGPDPRDLANPARGRGVSPRKLRLWACACARAFPWQPLPRMGRELAVIGKVEAWADGVTEDKPQEYDLCDGIYILLADNAVDAAASWAAADDEAERAELPHRAELLRCVAGSPFRPLTPLWEEVNEPVPVKAAKKNPFAEAAAKAGALFRKVKRPAVPWLPPTVLALAGAAYAEPRRCGACGGGGFAEDAPLSCNDCHGTTTDGLLDNDNLARLSDALEESGCADAALLAHLRDPGPHVKGCWAVDTILGKE